MRRRKKSIGFLGDCLARRFGAGSALAERAVLALAQALQRLGRTRRQRIAPHWRTWTGLASWEEKNRPIWEQLCREYRVGELGGQRDAGPEILLAIQTYFALVVKLVVQIWAEMADRPGSQVPSGFTADLWLALERGQTSVGRCLGLDEEHPLAWCLYLPSRWRHTLWAQLVEPLSAELADMLQHWKNSSIAGTEHCSTKPLCPEKGGYYKDVQYTFGVEEHASQEPAGTAPQHFPEPGGGALPQGQIPAGWADRLFRDHFQQLYQALLPRSVRRRWGEYPTPDDLARHVLRLAGYRGPKSGRLLDPACGSGSFLMAALYVAWENAQQCSEQPVAANLGEEGENPGQGLPRSRPGQDRVPGCLEGKGHIPGGPARKTGTNWPNWFRQAVERIVGWDRSGLAVLAARANWLLALSPWLDLNRPIQIPIFLQDALPSWPIQRASSLCPCSQAGQEALQPASVPGEPSELVQCTLAKTSSTDQPVSVPGKPSEPVTAFGAPSAPARFDFVVGNPPWLVWDHLEAEYRQATGPLWRHYGLFSLSAKEARHGGAKKDLAALLSYVAADRYLTSGGRLAMLLPNSLLYTQGAGDGFRRFQLPDGAPLKVLRVEDFSELRLFGNSAPRTIALVLQKGEPTVYPVRYVRWRSVKQTGTLDTSGSDQTEKNSLPSQALGLSLPLPSKEQPFSKDHVLCWESGGLSQAELCLAEPILPDRPSSPWWVRPALAEHPEAGGPDAPKAERLASWRRWLGPADYVAYLGANTGGANEMFWFELVGLEAGKARLRNWRPTGRGRNPKTGLPLQDSSGAAAAPPVSDAAERADSVAPACPNCSETVLLEPELLFPLVRWQDVQRWQARPSCWILLVQDPERRRGVDPDWLQQHCPAVWEYLQRQEERLRRRAAYRRYQAHAPFYSLYNVGRYTLSLFKVVWRRMDRQVRAAVLEPMHTPWGLRPIVPQETCCFIATETAEEAYYLSALLNSGWLNRLVESASLPGSKGFGSPGMLRWIRLRRFDPADARHRKLAELALAAHQLRQRGKEPSCEQTEIEALVREL